MKITVQARIVALLERKGPQTISQIVAAVGRHVPAAQAMRYREHTYRCWKKKKENGPTLRRTSAQLVELGNREYVCRVLCKLAERDNRIRRMSRGVYGPLEDRRGERSAS
jgi:hypothetical protein